MAPVWRDSTDKHGIARADQIYALLHPTYVREITDPGPDVGRIVLYIGPPHGQTDRELEILVHHYDDGRDSVIFHAMDLGPKFRRFREES